MDQGVDGPTRLRRGRVHATGRLFEPRQHGGFPSVSFFIDWQLVGQANPDGIADYLLPSGERQLRVRAGCP
jgi:hypothetical protein